MKEEEFIEKLKTSPTDIAFSDTMNVIEENYQFTETAFTNGSVINSAGENSGSCKVFAFAKKHNLSKDETLACFGTYYFNDVLKDPDGDSHQNIRNFMRTGFDGLSFEGEALMK